MKTNKMVRVYEISEGSIFLWACQSRANKEGEEDILHLFDLPPP